VISHRSAAALWSLIGFPEGPIELTLGHNSNARAPAATVHLTDDLDAQAVTRDAGVGGLPVTSPARTLVDLAGCCTRPHLRLALDEAVAAGVVDEAALARLVRQLARPGKRGVRLLGDLLDERAAGPPASASRLERLLFKIIADAGLPPTQPQYSFPGRQVVQGCVDAAYPTFGVAIEADGRRWHARRADLARDRLRDNEAVRAGWVTLRFMEPELRCDPESVAATIGETLDRRRGRLVA
jgi:hypothetical protein